MGAGGDRQQPLASKVGKSTRENGREGWEKCAVKPVVQVSSLPTSERFVALIAGKKTLGQGFSLATLFKCCPVPVGTRCLRFC